MGFGGAEITRSAKSIFPGSAILGSARVAWLFQSDLSWMHVTPIETVHRLPSPGHQLWNGFDVLGGARFR
jgi:hypothetical protein